MVLDYQNVEWTKAEHFKGGENFIWLKVQDDGQNKIVLMKIPTGSTVGYHKHEGSCETMYFLEPGRYRGSDGRGRADPGPRRNDALLCRGLRPSGDQQFREGSDPVCGDPEF